MAGLNMGVIKAMPLRLPPMSLQRKFVKLKAVIQEVREVEEAALKNAEDLFAVLRKRAFRGDLIRETCES
jgi:type I restriction enzyme S subunit